MPNFELTGEDAYKFFCMLPENELDKFLTIMQSEDEETDTDTEQ